MKSLLKSLVFSVFLVMAMVSHGQVGESVWVSAGTTESNRSYSVASPSGVTGFPVLGYINATSDAASTYITFYIPDDSRTTITNTVNAGTTVVTVAGSTGFDASDWVLIQDVSANAFQFCQIVGTGTDTLTLTNIAAQAAETTDFALAAGDLIYEMTTSGQVPVGVATKEINGTQGGLFATTRGNPFAVQVTGNTNTSIFVSGFYK